MCCSGYEIVCFPPASRELSVFATDSSLRRRYEESCLSLLPSNFCQSCRAERSSESEEGKSLWKQTLITVGILAPLCIFFTPFATSLASLISKAFTVFCQKTSAVFRPLISPISELSPNQQLGLSAGIVGGLSLASPPFLSGIQAGCTSFKNSVLWIFLLNVVSSVAIAVFRKEENLLEDQYSGALTKNLFSACILGPFLEELFFRIIVPYIITYTLKGGFWLAEKITGVDLTATQNHILEPIKNIFSAVCFGLAHFNNPHPRRIQQVLTTGFLAARAFNPLQQDFGLPGSAGYHMVNNTTVLFLQRALI